MCFHTDLSATALHNLLLLPFIPFASSRSLCQSPPTVCAKARLPVLLLLVLLSQHCFYAQFVHGPKSYVKQSPGSASKRRNSCKCIINYYMNYFLKVRRKEKVCLCLRGEVRGRRRRQAQRRRLTRESDEGNEH